MKKNLDDMEAILPQIALPVLDLPVAGIPDIFIDQILRQLVLFDEVMHAGHDDILIVVTVEDADIPAARQRAIDTPHVVVVLFFTVRLLEGNDMDAIRIQMREDVLDRPVLACRIHRLQDDDEPIGTLCIELCLQEILRLILSPSLAR